MRASVTLREATAATLADTRNELEAQRNATEFAYRKRIHETERAEGELEWQRKNVRCSSYTFCWFELNMDRETMPYIYKKTCIGLWLHE